jgi:preprotein translocase subunit Sss1
MTTWVKSHFSDSKHAMTTISVASLSIGAIGFAIVLLTTLLAK